MIRPFLNQILFNFRTSNSFFFLLIMIRNLRIKKHIKDYRVLMPFLKNIKKKRLLCFQINLLIITLQF